MPSHKTGIKSSSSFNMRLGVILLIALLGTISTIRLLNELRILLPYPIWSKISPSQMPTIQHPKDVDTGHSNLLWISSGQSSWKSTVQPLRVDMITAEDVKENHFLYKLGLTTARLFSGNYGAPLWKSHQRYTYSFGETAVLLSHLRAIKKAFDIGLDHAIIIEEDTLVEPDAVNFTHATKFAPPDWEVLQLCSRNSKVASQGGKMADPWISWQPDHYGTQGYIINRAGMDKIVAQFVRPSQKKNWKWNLSGEVVFLAEEAIYWYTKSYTATHPLLIRSEPPPETKHVTIFTEKIPENNYDRILVMMNLIMKNKEAVDIGMEELFQDVEFLCSRQPESRWAVRLVITDIDLRDFVYEKMRPTGNPSCDVSFQFEIRTDKFNKYELLAKFIPDMVLYDFILVKDSDERIQGFPWNTFIHMARNKAIAGPLTQNRDESVRGFSLNHEVRQWFKFHDARGWKHSRFSPMEFQMLEPINVPFLEQYLVLVDGAFGQWYFSQVLSSEFLHLPADWGVDLMWCSAAENFQNQRGSCALVPVVAPHEDTQTYSRGADPRGMAGAKHIFEKNIKFSAWLRSTSAYTKAVGGSNAAKIWKIFNENHTLAFSISQASNFDQNTHISG